MPKFSKRTQCKGCKYNDEKARQNDKPCCTYGGRIEWDTNKTTMDGDPACLTKKEKKD